MVVMPKQLPEHRVSAGAIGFAIGVARRRCILAVFAIAARLGCKFGVLALVSLSPLAMAL
jgi:hypothetical protein